MPKDGEKSAQIACQKLNSSFYRAFSDGNVHSHIDHLKAMIVQGKEGIKKVRVHILLDGRDVGETSALEYVTPFETFLSELNDSSFDGRIASGGGRMFITMDRYEANWSMVERGWHTHVLGEGRLFNSATEAIETLRKETKAIDQDLPSFVIAENGKPVGTIEDGDSVIFFNFRGDRAIEISKALKIPDLITLTGRDGLKLLMQGCWNTTEIFIFQVVIWLILPLLSILWVSTLLRRESANWRYLRHKSLVMLLISGMGIIRVSSAMY